MKVTALSGFGVKGPAAFLVEAGGRRLLLDLGEGPDNGTRPDLAGIGRIDAVLLSHAHADHTGALDLAPGLGSPEIWATPIVAELQDVARFGTARSLPLAGETVVAGLPVLTGRAGHAPGAVWMRIGGAEGLLYTGDISFEGVLYAADPPPLAAALICDASYGDYDAPLSEGVEALAAMAGRGPLLLPAPAGGRGLEMAVLLHERGLAVRLCPAHRALARMLLARPDILAPERAGRLERAVAEAAPLSASSAPDGAMIAARPNADAGLAMALVRRWEDDPAVAIVFTGHVGAGTPAQALVDAGRAIVIRWNVHPRLSELHAMIDRVRPQLVMPAFLGADRLAGLDLGRRIAGPVLELAE